MKFFVPMKNIPTVTHQEHQVTVVKGKPVFYEPPRLKQARLDLTDYLAGYRPKKPLTGPLVLIVKFCYPAGKEHQNGEPKTTKPDVDNTMKLLQDVMNSLDFFEDDRFITSLVAEKYWADLPGIFIQLETLGGQS